MRVVLSICVFIVFCENFCCKATHIRVPDVGLIFGFDGYFQRISYNRFWNIPYANVPQDQLFAPPIPAGYKEENPPYKPINGRNLFHCVWSGGHYRNYDEFSPCLVLNIQSKNCTGNSPVLVNFYRYNQKLYKHKFDLDITYMALKKDIVTVTVQYRVGAYGFLSTLTDEIKGNNAMLDIIEALRWIQKYIKHFGGDPNRVTVMGQHVAAGIIGVLASIDAAKGLFHRIIYQNGSPLMEGFETSDPLKIAREVGHRAGCHDEEKNALTKCLLQVDPRDMVQAYNSFWKENEGKVFPFTSGFDPIFDKSINPEPYPMIGGFVEYPTVHLMEDSFGRNTSRFSRKYLEEQFRNELRQFRRKSSNKGINEDEFLEMKGKEMLNKTAFYIKDAVARSLLENAANGGNSYAYIFKYKGSCHHYKPKEDNILGRYVDMGDDALYFGDDCADTGSDHEILLLMMNLWTSFGTTGIPESKDIEWPEITSDKGPYLVIDIDSYMFNGTAYEKYSHASCDHCSIIFSVFAVILTIFNRTFSMINF